ncbi:hypothetical protein SBI_08353 [Streptomyces bingchenggensis BCW-1]|uniref:Uncharacterized protein n=1 Tax=Streptomyces bingchenggensis (strain BCW-1) TaxID=749414 RepID=D7BSH4_STRBB|nr:hypothetical protein SBI_08353 [Streptomyces bingchenggensis BCW-1]
MRFPPALVGVAVGVGAVGIGGVGATLTLAGIDSPLRAPFTLFFLITAPASALGGALRGLDRAARAVLAGVGALALDLLVAQAMLTWHMWSVRGGVPAVGAVSLVLFLSVRLLSVRQARARRRRHARSSPRTTSSPRTANSHRTPHTRSSLRTTSSQG